MTMCRCCRRLQQRQWSATCVVLQWETRGFLQSTLCWRGDLTCIPLLVIAVVTYVKFIVWQVLELCHSVGFNMFCIFTFHSNMWKHCDTINPVIQGGLSHRSWAFSTSWES